MAEAPAEFNPQHNLGEYTVSEVAGGIKRMVEERFGYVRVRGEISGWRGPHSSGHAYFRLKDDKAVLDAVCWKGTLSKVGCKPEEGLEVIATGRITTYPGKSSYQIVIERMEPAGVGALMALLEKRKAALAAEGLFDPSRKRPLPFLPRTIGIVTSSTGAVIRDILHRLADRCPVRVLVWPVAVQGETAAAQIAEAIHGFNALNPQSQIPSPDLLIVARGGGSIEDLWAFNEEAVVRAAAASRIPLISAVGHETDTTLIDYVSDYRAPTPTAAAEKAVPVLGELRLGVAQLRQRLEGSLLQDLTHRRERLEGLRRGLPRPQMLLEHAMQRLDTAAERLRAALPGLLTQRESQLAHLSARLRPTLLAREIETARAQLQGFEERARNAYQRLIDARAQRLEHLAALMAQLDVRQVLKRGFALVRKEGKLVTTAAQASGTLTLVFQDGEVEATTP